MAFTGGKTNQGKAVFSCSRETSVIPPSHALLHYNFPLECNLLCFVFGVKVMVSRQFIWRKKTVPGRVLWTVLSSDALTGRAECLLLSVPFVCDGLVWNHLEA